MSESKAPDVADLIVRLRSTLKDWRESAQLSYKAAKRQRDGSCAQSSLLAHADAHVELAEEIEKLLTADALDARAQTWQPIESAPKDGTVIIGLDSYGDIGKVHWDERYEPHGWMVEGGMATLRLTHWFPLPTPPSEK